ncbi:hypothetical protein, partial [Parasedimentitalea maritima]|uniref:hypothetical protein n=1 Tax=Parasedimentitalea maritima TaxID=2578117 RepID=UPI001ADBDF41
HHHGQGGIRTGQPRLRRSRQRPPDDGPAGSTGPQATLAGKGSAQGSSIDGPRHRSVIIVT